MQYGAKFKVLYDDAPTVNFKEVEQIFQEEFGKGPSEIFSEFDPAPIASASIAQVLLFSFVYFSLLLSISPFAHNQ